MKLSLILLSPEYNFYHFTFSQSPHIAACIIQNFGNMQISQSDCGQGQYLTHLNNAIRYYSVHKYMNKYMPEKAKKALNILNIECIYSVSSNTEKKFLNYSSGTTFHNFKDNGET